MILPDHEIRALALDGAIRPYNEYQLQPSSYDVCLGPVFRIFVSHGTRVVDLDKPETFKDLTKRVEIEPDGEFVIHSGQCVLAQTLEVVDIPNGFVARIEGKSSIGRLGLIVHMAGYIDPGFNGVVTLELVNNIELPIVLHPGSPIAQLSFAQMGSLAEAPYEGRYQGDKEATASRYGL